MTKQKWIHFIGICGVTMAPCANMFKKKGWFVSGSDMGIFPPMSTYLKENEINIELGFKYLHLTRDYYKNDKIADFPDIVVVGNFATIKNPELLFARKQNITVKSYPEILKEYLVKDNSVVIAGTAGKTTCAALVTKIFIEAGLNPSFMVGGIASDLPDSIHDSSSKWSIIEGDEYISARFDPVSKFFFYSAEFLLLTSVFWEHTDVFKSEDDYVNNFQKLISQISPNGLIVACSSKENVSEALKSARCKVVSYELNKSDNILPLSTWFNLPFRENLNEILLYNRLTKQEILLKTNLIGDHNRENIIGSAALCLELNIKPEVVQKAVANFYGIKRRLEIKYQEENLIIFDDFASSPPKIAGSLEALRQTYKDYYITIIFEPNVGNRTPDALNLFKNIFHEADEVILPRFKHIKKTSEDRITENDLLDTLKKEDVNAIFISDDNELVSYVKSKNVGKRIICFMGAYSFRGMIDQVVKEFK